MQGLSNSAQDNKRSQ